MKVYGEEVTVAEGATTFERALGASGRNADWGALTLSADSRTTPTFRFPAEQV
jgi:hypothetical protein